MTDESRSLIGRSAPPFQLEAVRYGSSASRRVSLDSYAGTWLLIVFYPRDFSFVCPTELTAFSAHMDALRSRNCQVLGVSVDSVDDHRRWFETPPDRGGIGPLQFPLAADPGGVAGRAYGVWLEEQHCTARGLFIVDPAGALQYSVVHNASVGRSIEETLRVVDALQSGGLCPAGWTSADGTINAEEQLQPGRVLGHFRIVKKLGAGAFGNVLAADDLTLDRRVAIKIIGRTATVARDEVLAEARAAANLHHPHICTIFAVDTIDAVPVIVMEHVEGRPLSELNVSTLSASARRQIALGIARGLAHAHARGVVHGDLKPANIMIGPDGAAKLLDFGLARRGRSDSSPAVERVTVAHTETDQSATIIGEIDAASDPADRIRLTGTPAYMSPEQTLGHPVTIHSDVYAFGLVLCELLTGRSLVRAANLLDVLREIQSGAVRQVAVTAVPGNWRKTVAALLADDPANRPAMEDVIGWLTDEEFSPPTGSTGTGIGSKR